VIVARVIAKIQARITPCDPYTDDRSPWITDPAKKSPAEESFLRSAGAVSGGSRLTQGSTSPVCQRDGKASAMTVAQGLAVDVPRPARAACERSPLQQAAMHPSAAGTGADLDVAMEINDRRFPVRHPVADGAGGDGGAIDNDIVRNISVEDVGGAGHAASEQH
jgi:hypothetical protein